MSIKNYEVTIHTLPHLKGIRLVSMRSSHLPLKMHLVGFRAFNSPLHQRRRTNWTDLEIKSKNELRNILLVFIYFCQINQCCFMQ